ncbi:GNAT family N-acetyltransferase [Lacisediminihabitans sp. H27-G8]|uniref:GNAT family N-acetyltransferase n=1 Tax=Lacisediminihabitans sp. H27-G8 TaxID=3111909 RepID=UPI0038FC9B54
MIRQPRFSEAAVIAAIQVDGWRDTYGHLLPPEFYGDAALRRRVAMWTKILGGEAIPDRLFVAESSSRIQGFAFVGDSLDALPARPLCLYMIYVRSEHHGTGIGQALLEAAAREDPLQLWMAKDNPRAYAFYRRNGFVFEGTERVDSAANDLEEIELVR